MNTPFELNNRELELLDAQKAVELMHNLLCCEAIRQDVPLSKIHITKKIAVPDGGIDAEVEIGLPKKEDFIKKGLTAYQIKTGTSFKPQTKSLIKKELFGTKSVKKDNLGKAVKNCLDRKGTYILVCFSCDPTPEQIRESKTHIKYYLKQCNYKNVKVEVWGQTHLSSFINKFYPSIALKYQGFLISYFRSHESWGTNEDMRKPLVKNKEYDSLVEDFKNNLLKDEGPLHVRVIDIAGSGKTRFVFEATKDPEIKSLVIYFPRPQNIKNDLLPRLIREDNAFQVIIILDECNTQQKIEIWNQLKSKSPRIKLITIFNEFEHRDFDIIYQKIPGLGKVEIKTIIQNYDVLPEQAERYAELAGNSPRFAHMIGENLKFQPGDILKPIEDIYNRIIAEYDNPIGEKVQKRRRLLRYLALFKRFGYDPPFEAESNTICNKVRDECKISNAEFEEIIEKLRELKILQGESTLYITPLALHIKMWSEWWEIHGRSFKFEKFLKDIPENSQLRLWFFEMFKYAKESQVANRVVEDLLSENGPFQKKSFIDSQIETRFFLALTEANPKAALKCLQRTIATWGKEQLMQLTIGRREIVWALEQIVIWDELFEGGARILLQLAEAENENYSNNATGIFIELFSPAFGKVAPTEASPQKRFPLLLEALNSKNDEIRNIALKACDMSFKSDHFTRMIGVKFQGLRREPNLWIPKSYREIFDYYRMVWNELNDKVDSLKDDEKKLVVNIFLHNARGLTRIVSLANMVIDTFKILSSKDYVDKKELLRTIIRILHYEGKSLPSDVRIKWEKLKSLVSGNDYSSLMKRNIGMNIIEDEFDEEGNRTDVSQKRIKELAHLSIKNIDLLKEELDWLVTEEAKNGYIFGHELALGDKNYSLKQLLLNALKKAEDNGSTFFIGGYFRALFEENTKKWEQETLRISRDKKLQKHFPGMLLRSGLTNKVALRVLQMAKENIISITELKAFAYGNILNTIKYKIVKEWIEFILNSKSNMAGTVAVTICNYYYLNKENINKFDPVLVFNVLTHKSFYRDFPPSFPDPMDDYYWTQLGKELVKKYKQYGLKLYKKIFRYFGVAGSILHNTLSSTHEVLNVVAQEYPKEIWKIVIKYLGPPIDDRAYCLYNWLRGGKFYEEPRGALNYIPFKEISNWVDEDVEKRAWYLSYFVPPQLFHSTDKRICYAREVLARYGHREDVLENFTANYSSEGWIGPSSLHYANKKEDLLKFKKTEKNRKVIRWIDKYLSEIDSRIKISKADEERNI